MSQEAQPFFRGVRDFIFGRPATLENIVRIENPFVLTLPYISLSVERTFVFYTTSCIAEILNVDL